MSVTTLSATTHNNWPNNINIITSAASAGHEQSFKVFSLKCSGVMAIFACPAKWAVLFATVFSRSVVPQIFNYVLMNIIISTHNYL